MGDGHLIAYSSERIVSCLFYFSVTKTREILLYDLSVFEGFFELFAVSGHFGSRIVGNIEILCAAIAFSGIE
jgi:hypothetical protein